MTDELDRFIAEQQAAAHPGPSGVVHHGVLVEEAGAFVRLRLVWGASEWRQEKISPADAESIAEDLIAAARKARNA